MKKEILQTYVYAKGLQAGSHIIKRVIFCDLFREKGNREMKGKMILNL